MLVIGMRYQPERGQIMVKNFEEFQQFSKEGFEVTAKSFDAASKTAQAIANEVVDYTKKSFEDGSQALEKLLGVKSVEKAIEVQQDYLKSAYEGFVAEANKIGALYVDFAKEVYKPFESYIAKANPAK
jgi:hypothetical protein